LYGHGRTVERRIGEVTTAPLSAPLRAASKTGYRTGSGWNPVPNAELPSERRGLRPFSPLDDCKSTKMAHVAFTDRIRTWQGRHRLPCRPLRKAGRVQIVSLLRATCYVANMRAGQPARSMRSGFRDIWLDRARHTWYYGQEWQVNGWPTAETSERCSSSEPGS